MAVKIRLARHGKKNYAFFHIVVADSRAPRDGRFIELLGTYNPNTNPASIILDCEKALDWLNKGAQPTDTCRRILSYKGVLLRKHLNKGVAKGAMTDPGAGRCKIQCMGCREGSKGCRQEGSAGSEIRCRQESRA